MIEIGAASSSLLNPITSFSLLTLLSFFPVLSSSRRGDVTSLEATYQMSRGSQRSDKYFMCLFFSFSSNI